MTTEDSVIAFQVKDMSCGHCVASITEAVQAADPGARVNVDLASRRVDVEPAAATADQLQQAIAEAGYAALPLPASKPR